MFVSMNYTKQLLLYLKEWSYVWSFTMQTLPGNFGWLSGAVAGMGWGSRDVPQRGCSGRSSIEKMSLSLGWSWGLAHKGHPGRTAEAKVSSSQGFLGLSMQKAP